MIGKVATKMRIQIEPSDIVCELDGVTVRVWNGVTEDGTQCFVFVQAVASRQDIAAELQRVTKPDIANVRSQKHD
jgi:hypothetical protein